MEKLVLGIFKGSINANGQTVPAMTLISSGYQHALLEYAPDRNCCLFLARTEEM